MSRANQHLRTGLQRLRDGDLAPPFSRELRSGPLGTKAQATSMSRDGAFRHREEPGPGTNRCVPGHASAHRTSLLLDGRKGRNHGGSSPSAFACLGAGRRDAVTRPAIENPPGGGLSMRRATRRRVPASPISSAVELTRQIG
jgi:hypothetical protein